MDIEKIKERYKDIHTQELMRMEIHEKDPFLNNLIEEELSSRGITVKDREPILEEESKKYSWTKALIIFGFIYIGAKIIRYLFG